MKSTLNIYPSSSIGEALSSCLKRCAGKPLLLLASGGSALQVLEWIDPLSLGPHITISVLDERVNTRTEDKNLFQLTHTDFYKKAEAKGVKFIPFFKDGGKRAVIAIMGIGLDGHTAGIMPFPEDKNKFKELFEGDEMLVEYDAGSKNEYPLRLTVTISFLVNMVDHAFVYVSGEGKKEILKTILNPLSGTISMYPALVIHKMKRVDVYTDSI